MQVSGLADDLDGTMTIAREMPGAAPRETSGLPLDPRGWLAALIESSDDAILSKTLDGIITSWNPGAERLFGYCAAEAIGRPITIIIPDERFAEEADIIARIRTGRRVEHFDTVRRRKDGSLVHVSLTISPVLGEDGRILGASKIARDITVSRQLAERQALMLREMHHRVKNSFALTAGLIRLSGRRATSVAQLVNELSGRLDSLARAHALTLPDDLDETRDAGGQGLRSLLGAVLAPHAEVAGERIAVSGGDQRVAQRCLPSLALLFHEFATNSAKYGALSVPEGRLTVELVGDAASVILTWVERGGPPPKGSDAPEGFGRKLEQASIQNLGGRIERDWADDGLTITLTIPAKTLAEG